MACIQIVEEDEDDPSVLELGGEALSPLQAGPGLEIDWHEPPAPSDFVVVDLESGQTEQSQKDQLGWSAGVNVGGYVSQRQALLAQGQVLLTNVYLNLAKLPRHLLQQICQKLPSLPSVSDDVRPLAAKAASRLLRLPGNTVSFVFHKVKNAGWTVLGRAAADDVPDKEDDRVESKEEHRKRVLTLLVREAIHNSCHARPDDEFVQSLQKLRLYSVDVGEKFASKKVLRLCEFVSAKFFEFLQADALFKKLPGLGVLSPISIVCGRRYVLQSRNLSGDYGVSCVTIHRLPETILLGMPISWTLQSTVVLSCLAGKNLSLAHLRARAVAMLGGDGAVTAGGPLQRHASTRAANFVADAIYPESVGQQNVVWDPFHRSEAAFKYALEQSEFGKELFAVARGMSQQFGFGCGRVLLRAVSGFLGDEGGEQTPAAANMGGTRKGESLILVASNVLRNFRRYAIGLHARLARRKAGHGAGSQSSLLVLGRRLLAPDFLFFTLLSSDVMNRQRPFTLAVQEQESLPWATELALARKQQQVLEDVDLLYEIRRLIAVIGLLQHYTAPTRICST